VNIKKLDTPNRSKRSINSVIDCIVIHDTGAHTALSTMSWFINPLAKVSAHYLIDKDGSIYQFVEDGDKAWHAGMSRLHGKENVNDFSIGIELVDASDADKYPQAQLDALIDLTTTLCINYNIPLNRVVGHADVAPGRKVDPGPDFPWYEFLTTLGSTIQQREINGTETI
jgi:N-acetylmuramoyl-L-alanine amidase